MDPVVLFFVFGLVAGLLKSELKLPAALYETLSIILLLAIGLHGGVELAEQASVQLLGQAGLVLLLGIGLPLLAFALLRGLRFDRVNAAAVAAHYGSVSAGTFAVVVAFLVSRQISFESYMPLFVAILEIPAILVGILLAKGVSRGTDWKELGREIFLGKSIMLLLGGLVIGAVAGKEAIKPLEPLYTSMFKPVLAFFLLEMGLIASGQLGALKQFGLRLLGFALLMPLQSAPRALAGCTGGVGSGVIADGGYVDQGCGQADQSAAIGAAPSAGTIIACRNISGCLSQAVNGPGGVSVPQRSTVVQQSQ